MTTKTLLNRTVLITGASGGIGQSISLTLASSGIKTLFLHYFKNEKKITSLVDSIKSNFQDTVPIVLQADLSTESGIRKLINEVDENTGEKGVDIIVSNAGVAERVKDWTTISPTLLLQTLQTNILPTFLLSQHYLPKMSSSKYGRFIATSSIASFTGGRVGPHYSASKAAINGLVYSLASKYAKNNVTVNAVAPLMIEETEMLDPEWEKLLENGMIPVGRLGRPEEVAGTVKWICETGYLNGKVIGLDGGLRPM